MPAGQSSASRDFDIADAADDFEHFATSREHAAIDSLVQVESLHELDFFERVFTFTGRGVDLTTTIDLEPSFKGLDCNGSGLATVASSLALVFFLVLTVGLVIHSIRVGKIPAISATTINGDHIVG